MQVSQSTSQKSVRVKNRPAPAFPDKRSAVSGGFARLDEPGSPLNRDKNGDGNNGLKWSRTIAKHSFHVQRQDRLSGFAWQQDVAVVIRGYAVSERSLVETPDQAASYVLDHYLQNGQIPYQDLEGSFAVLIFDARDCRILMYRNLAGTTNIFYRPGKSSFSVCTNLRDLVGQPGLTDRLNEKLLPVFFMFRCIPGRETLFDNCFRLMPGELIEASPGKFSRQRVSEFATPDSSEASGRHHQRDNEEQLLEELTQTLSTVVRDCVRSTTRSGVMLSGGVDSTLLQSFWNESSGLVSRDSYCVTVDHPRTAEEYRYAQSAARGLDVNLNCVSADGRYTGYLDSVIAETAETPNHVQAAYFPELAQRMVADGVTTGISGEAGDGVFGVGTSYELQLAERIRRRVRSRSLCRLLAETCVLPRLARLGNHFRTAAIIDDRRHFEHPINRQASYSHLPAVVSCFGEPAVAKALGYRRRLIVENKLSGSLISELHAANLLTSSINSASYWNTLFEIRGGQVLNPFLDSRILRLAMSLSDSQRFVYGEPKRLLKRCLQRRGFAELANRPKRGFGQPIFEWMSLGGQLRCLVDQIQPMSFVDRATLEEARKEPNWFLYNLLCLDRLKKRFNV